MTTDSELEHLVIYIFFFLLIFSLVQIITGNLAFKTSTYRLSSVYGDNVTGFSLIMTTIFLYFYHLMNYKFTLRNIFFTVACLSMIFATQSRLALVSSFFLVLIYHLLKFRTSFKSFLLTLISIILIIAVVNILIIDLNLAPRLIQSFEIEFQDASSQSRIIAWTAVIGSLSNFEIFFGIGAGGFHHRYQLLTGIEGMDAHFDFIKIYVEHGLIVSMLYISSIAFVIMKLLKQIAATKSGNYVAALVIFLNAFVFSSLHNAYFYFESLMLGCIIIGVLASNANQNILIR